jgi:hypothetical protein
VRLPDFLLSVDLLDLRDRMRADKLGELTLTARADTLTEAELDSLSGGGIDVSWSDVRVLQDGTLAYKDVRVVLYIRDIHPYGKQSIPDRMPKFHVSDCRTLADMRTKGRSSRYVVATRVDGLFSVNIVKANGVHHSRDAELAVCQNCLSNLSFDGFHHGLDKKQKGAVVERFTLARFFEQYPHTLLQRDDHHDDVTAPLNDYSRDFPQIAADLKALRGLRCEDCGLLLEQNGQRRFLHVHHINGMRYDNALSNLRLLCFGCHAEQPNHGHMRASPDYQEFLTLFADRRR